MLPGKTWWEGCRRRHSAIGAAAVVCGCDRRRLQHHSCIHHVGRCCVLLRTSALGPRRPQALATFGSDIAIAFSGAEDVALIEYAHLTGRPYRVFRCVQQEQEQWGGVGMKRWEVVWVGGCMGLWGFGGDGGSRRAAAGNQ